MMMFYIQSEIYFRLKFACINLNNYFNRITDKKTFYVGKKGNNLKFQAYDIEKNGVINADEMKEWMWSHGKFLTSVQGMKC